MIRIWKSLNGTRAGAAATLLMGLLLGAPAANAQTAAYLGQPLGGGFSSPDGVAVDGSGNVYVADNGNKAVKEIPAGCTSAGCVTTLGGGFSSPDGVAVDGSGNVYVADYNTTVVKKIPAGCTSASCVTTLGGGFGNPRGVAVDGSGNVYVADYHNNAVKEIPPGCTSSSCVTTLGGGFSGAFDVAVDGSGSVYVAASGGVSKMPAGCISSSCVTTLGGGFSFPNGVAVDGSGNVYVADSGNNAVEEMPADCTSAGCVTTLGGGFSDPEGVAVDGRGNVYVSDTYSNDVKEIVRQGLSLASSSVGSSTTETLTFTIYSAGSMGAPVALTKGAPGKDFTDAGTGTCTTNGTGHSYAENDTCTVVVQFSPQYAGVRYGTVELVNPSGTVLASALLYGSGIGPQLVFNGPLTATVLAGYGYASRVAVDGGGNVYVAGLGPVGEIPAGCQSSSCVVTLGGGVNEADGVAVDGSGNLYVADYGNGEVKEIPTGCTLASCVTTLGGGFSYPEGVAVDGSGDVYVADTGNIAVKEIPAGCVSSTCVKTLGGGFTDPSDVAVDGSGNVYVAESFNSSVKEIPVGCVSSTCVKTLGGGFSLPNGVAVDGSGNVYVADTDNNAVKEIPAGCTLASCVTTLGGGFSYPYGVAVDGSGNIYVANYGSNAVLELARATAPTISFPTATFIGALDSTDGTQTVTLNNIGNAPLSFPRPGSGYNPSFPAGFLFDSGSTCSQLNSNSGSAYTLAAGAMCNLGIDFKPASTDVNSGQVVLTDNNLNVSGTTQSIAVSGMGLETITINTSPAGLRVSVDGGAAQTAPVSVNWVVGSNHSIAATSPQGSNGTRYTFSNWSDSGALSHMVTASSATTSYTATFSTSYLLTSAVSPAGNGTITPNTASPTSDGYYPAGTSLALTATPSSAAYLFSSWTGTTASSSNPLSITMSAPVSETANFATNPGSDGGALLAYEPFGETAGTPLQGASGSGDSGWAAPWTEQSGSSAEPGYQTASANPLSYPGLATTSTYAIGGYSYQSAGRQLNVSSAGPFSSYLSNGLIGAAGQTIWVSCLLREDANPANGEINAIFLTPDGGLNAWLAQTGIGIGSFGGNWGLQYNNGTPVVSNVPVTPAQTVLLVAGITFGATNQINLYVNPTSLGSAAPATPSAQLTTTGSVAFQSVSYLGGYTANDSSLGDIRIGPSYASVTHTLLTPQTITFSPLASPVTYPAGPFTLTATASSGLPVTFSVLSGPALVNGNTLTITGVGTVVVAANQVGNFLYAPAPQVTQGIVVSVAGTPPSTPAGALLAYEPFNETSGSTLNGASGGGDSGWAAGWVEQVGSTVEPGYEIASANPLSYSGLQPTTNYAIGGYSYQSAGRQLDVSAAGPFSSYLSNGLIGAPGQTVWLSFLLREDANPNNGQINAVFLTPDGGIGAWLTQTGIGIGYFGGSPYWGLQLNSGTPMLSSVPVTQGQTALLVVSITFGTSNQVTLYVNPTLGGSVPSTPSAQLTTAASVAFESLSYLGGYGTDESSLAAIRFGSTYAAVTPTTGQTTQSAQTINFIAPASPVTYPVAPIMLSATASSGLPVTLSVMSGPGSVTGNTLTVTGTGTIVIAANQAGNASYAPAAQVTQSIVVNPSGGASSGTVLAYEPFGETSGTPLNGATGSGDSGWNGAWVEQGGSTAEPGYQIASATPLTYSGLATTGHYAMGGYDYQSAGRQLNTAVSGPFLSYLANGLIGAPGQTIWLSFLLREDANPNNGQMNAIFLTPASVPWVTQTGVGIGYFGASPYWGLQLNNGTPLLSTVPVVQGQTVLIVVSITFGATNQINLYVNPTVGGSVPSTPSAQLTTAASVAFQSFSYLGGYMPNGSSLADITFGSSYDAVTPAP